MAAVARRRRREDGTGARWSVPARWLLLAALLGLLGLQLGLASGATLAAQDEEEEAGAGADGTRVTRWRKHRHLSPCVGCTSGEAMRLGPMFSRCSLFTFGEHMGVLPLMTNLTLSTNETVLVHLVGSRLYFPSAQAFFGLASSLMQNSTCPAPSDEADSARRVRNITSLCAVADPEAGGALVGGLRLEGVKDNKEGGALCVIYSVEAVPGGEEGEGQGRGEGNSGWAVAGLYGPGDYRFNFSAFRTDEFRYAFWSVQFLRLEEGAAGDDDGAGMLRANVTSNGSFLNNPPALPKPMLVNAFFVAALVACAVFIAVYNPVVGPLLVDLGSRSPFLRRHVFEHQHPGPVPQLATAPPLPGAPRRQLSSRSSGNLGWGGRATSHYTLMEDRKGEEIEEAGSP